METPWGTVWATICSWPAAIAAFVRATWPQLRIVCAGVAGAIVENLREKNAAHEVREEETEDFQQDQRRIRLDPSYREQLRRQSGKPPPE